MKPLPISVIRSIALVAVLFLWTLQSSAQSCGYGFSKTITIDHEQVSGTSPHFDFPVLISLTDNDLRTTGNGGDVQNANGFDIVFIDGGSGQQLAHQVEEYNASTGNFIAWVRVPVVYPDFDTEIQMLYGNDQIAANPSTTETWDDGYQAVWHLHDDLNDGTSFGNDGTNSGSGDATGLIADAQTFDGSTDYILRTDANWNGDVPALSTGSPNEFTLSGWINVDNLNNRQPLLSKQGDGAGNDRGFVFMMEDDNRLKIELFKNNVSGTRTEVFSTSFLTTGTWYYMAVTYEFVTDGTSICNVYLDGVEEGTTTAALGPIFDNPRDVEIGRYFFNGGANYWMDGEIDEVRISNVVRSADWIATEYESQSDPANFYSVGPEVAGITTPIVPVCGSGFKRTLTVDNTEVSGTTAHTDFPVLVNLTNNDFRTVANGGNVENANGWDITFTDENLVPLDYDLESYDGSTGEVVAWVRIPSLPTGTDYTFFMLYGNPDVFVDPSTPCTWVDYAGVWHLHDDFLDATTNDEDATNNGSTDNTTSQIADGQSFDGGDFLELNSFPNLTTDFTISGWIRTTDNTEAGQRVFCDDESNSGGYALSLGDGGTGRMRFYSRNMSGVILDGSANAVSNNTWYYISGVVDRTNQDRFIYIDGVQDAADLTDGGTWGTDNANASIGGETNGGETGNRFEGLMDEVRVSTVARSSDWLVTEYNNQSDPTNFITLGAEEDLDVTSTQNGDWDLTTTWAGGVVPSDGANVTLQHNVDLDDRDVVLCNLTIETAADVASVFTVNGGYEVTVTENLYMKGNSAAAGDATLRTVTGNEKVVVRKDMLVDASSGDDVEIEILNGGDSLIVEGNLIMTQSDGDDMELIISNATAGVRIEGNLTVNLSGGLGDLFIIDINNGQLEVKGTTSLNRTSDFEDLSIDMEDGIFATDSLYMSSTGGTGNDQVNITLDGTAELNVTNNLTIDHDGGDDLNITINNNNGTSAELNVGGDFRINKTGGDDLNMTIDNANSELTVGGVFEVVSSGGEQVTLLMNDGSISVTDSFRLHQLDNVQQMLVTITNTSVVSTGTVDLLLDNGGNQELLVDMEDAAEWTVNGDVLVTMNDGNDLEFHMGENSVGSTAELTISGDLTLDHNPSAGGDDIQFIISDVSTVDVGGDFTMDTDGASGAGNFYTRLNGNSNLNVTGDIVMTGANGSGEIEIEMNANTDLTIGGNFVRDAAPSDYGLLQSNSNNARITYDGIAAQIFADEDGAGTDGIEYERVVINNTFATEPQLTMEAAVTLDNAITFTDGVLQTTAVDLLTFADGIVSNEGNADSYVSGPLRKVGNDPFVFPIGKDGFWARLEISDAIGTALADEFTAEYFRAANVESFWNPSQYGGNTGGLFNTSTKEYWELDRDAGTAQPVVSLYWEDNTTSDITDTGDLVVAHYIGATTWVNEGGFVTGLLAAGKVSTTGNINTFSPFTFGSEDPNANPLPVELTDFRAIPKEDHVELVWATATEVNNDYFTVERSKDGQVFEPVLEVEGAGNSNTPLLYEAKDDNPFAGTSFYRLMQTDFDGTSHYSELKPVTFDQGAFPSRLYPNPAQHNVHSTKELHGELTDALGRTVKTFNGETSFSVRDIPAGIYYLRLTTSEVHKLVIE